MAQEGEGAKGVAQEIQVGLGWSTKHRKWWSFATHGTTIAIISFSALAAIFAQSDSEFLSWPLKNWATSLSVVVTIVATIQMRLGFERKWASFRVTHTALRFLDLDRLLGAPMNQVRARLEAIYQAHDQAVIGGTPIADIHPIASEVTEPLRTATPKRE